MKLWLSIRNQKTYSNEHGNSGLIPGVSVTVQNTKRAQEVYHKQALESTEG